MRKLLLLVAGIGCCISLTAQRHITTADELRQLATESQTSDFAGQTIVLDNDIDLNSQSWQPIGCAAHPFQGQFDGQNHVIRNMHITGVTGAAGLFAETGEQAEIHHVALSQGLIYLNNQSNIGSFVGIHRGSLHHCFNMLQIAAHNGDSIGGLVGTNYGTIRYAYNTGIITDANDVVGGLVGKNKATALLSNCYNVGYSLGSKHIGSLFGENEAGSTLDSVYFDQQVTRMHATGYGSSDPSLVSNDHIVAKTTEMLSIFTDMTQWDTTFVASYPQLACFAGVDASKLSVYGILLDSEGQPIERADGVGAPTNDEKPRESFGLCQVEGTTVTWFSPNENVIEITSPKEATVYRPCGNQQVILTVSLGEDVKEIYTQVKGYDTFDAGKLDGQESACLNAENVLLSGHGKEPSGGKDDEQDDKDKSYQYMVFRDSVAYDAYGDEVLYRLDTFLLNYQEYQAWSMPTDAPGLYVFTQRVHDFQCQTDFVDSEGELRLLVREPFDPGKLYQKPDTIYGLPADTVVLSERDASGGSGTFNYLWTYAQLQVDYTTGEVDTVAKGIVRNPQTYVEITTATCPVHLTVAGEYIYWRKAKDASCADGFQASDIEHRIVVYDALRAGGIESASLELCDPTYDGIIQESRNGAVSGGNGRYTYRWLCNGEPIADSDSSALSLAGFPMEPGHTYEFQRQVKDDSGFSDWQTSAGKVTLIIYTPYSAGSIRDKEDRICLEPNQPQEVTLHADNQQVANGDGEFIYAWLLYRAAADTVLLDTLQLDAPSLDYAFALTDYQLTAPVHLLLRRTVQNSRCRTAWQNSSGLVDYTIGMHRYDTLDVPVCALDLPYIGTYTYADGHTDTYTIRQDSDIILRHDQTAEGCPYDVTLIGRAIREPVVEVQPVVSVCQTDTVLLLQYHVLDGSPDHYDIAFNDSALAVGFMPLMGGQLTDSTEVAISIPTTKIGVYGLTIRFYTATVGESECKGPELHVHFSLDISGYVHRKWNDVVFVDNSDKNCEPNCEEDLTFVAWQWYKDDVLIPGATGQSYYEPGGLNGFYYVVMTATDGTIYRSCRYEMRPAQAIDNVQDESLRLYPVPAQAGSLLHIEAESAGYVEWFNLEGVCCYRQELTSATGSIRVPALGGLYLLRWIGDNHRVITRKLIVQ